MEARCVFEGGKWSKEDVCLREETKQGKEGFV